MPRIKLPNRRFNQTFSFSHEGMNYLMTVGYTREATPIPLELFINTSMRSGNAADIAACDAAIAVSLALQHGCPLSVLCEAMKRNADGSPSGIIGQALDIMNVAELKES